VKKKPKLRKVLWMDRNMMVGLLKSTKPNRVRIRAVVVMAAVAGEAVTAVAAVVADVTKSL
jgi:hypothetical protein